ncbi:hypothetical protein LPJ66_008983 [Kickxella alabastrina]|uniref:Uncharacterized protein n=1 Tax=Kickxella alabastrina TaxID=61397 RepID=A0ACC1I720_9FUNG|nr:hypothetical protein LPJ66_008983 [Kickxella alabastrina]
MGLPNQHRGSAGPASKTAHARPAASKVAKAAPDTTQKRSTTGSLLAKPKTQLTGNGTRQQQQQQQQKAKHSNIDPMTVCIDLASQIGLAISGSNPTQTDSDDVDVAAANERYMQQMDADNYGSDDDLGESEETQAGKMKAEMLDRLAAFDKQLLDKWMDADRRDYEVNGEVLDQEVVNRRLDLLKTFALHLRRIGKNRASLLARLTEPMAEEHWVLGPAYHQQMVDAFRTMCRMINNLPEMAAAARHCMAPETLRALENAGQAEGALADGTASKARQIAQMERLVHEVEQVIERLHLETSSTKRDTLLSSL